MTTPGTPVTVSITVALFAELRQYLPAGIKGSFAHAVAPGATVESVLRDLGVPGDTEITVGLNGEQGALDSELQNGDELQLFTPMQGG